MCISENGKPFVLFTLSSWRSLSSFTFSCHPEPSLVILSGAKDPSLGMLVGDASHAFSMTGRGCSLAGDASHAFSMTKSVFPANERTPRRLTPTKIYYFINNGKIFCPPLRPFANAAVPAGGRYRAPSVALQRSLANDAPLPKPPSHGLRTATFKQDKNASARQHLIPFGTGRQGQQDFRAIGVPLSDTPPARPLSPYFPPPQGPHRRPKLCLPARAISIKKQTIGRKNVRFLSKYDIMYDFETFATLFY